MSSILGIWHRDGVYASKQEMGNMMQALDYVQWDAKDIVCTDHLAFGHLMMYNSAESLKEKNPYSKDGLIIVADIRLDNREELIGLLPAMPGDSPDSYIVLEAYRQWGEDCAIKMEGDYSFVIWDSFRQCLFCCRDHIGIRPFFYYADEKIFVFASDIKALVAVDAVDKRINEQWIAYALANMKSGREATAYTFVKRLAGAHTLTVGKDRMHKKKYWELDMDATITYKDHNQYIDAFSELLMQSIRKRMRSVFPIAGELSGGIDSSAVCSYASRAGAGKQFYAFSHVAPECTVFPFRDERDYAQQVCRYNNIEHIMVDATEKGLLNAMKEALNIFTAPVQTRYHYLSDCLYAEAAKRGVRTMLSGFGGDQVTSIQAHYVWIALAKQGRWYALWQTMKKNKKYPFVEFFIHAIRHFCPEVIKTISGIQSYYRWREQQNFSRIPILANFSQQQQLKKHYFDFVFRKQPSTLNEIIRELFYTHHVALRFDFSALSAKAYAIDYAYPLLDRKLIQYFLSMPSEIKIYKGQGRYVIREAMRDYVPDSVRLRNDKKGATIPNVRSRLLKDIDAVRNLIDRCSSPYVDQKKMQTMLDSFVTGHNTGHIALFIGGLELLLFEKMR